MGPAGDLSTAHGRGSGVEALLLGIAQDGGVPQAGCHCDNCSRAWAGTSQRQWVACLGLVDHEAGASWLIDATPDFRDQLHALEQLAPGCPLAGIVLTHAHVGHYAGLIHLGREVMNSHRLPVFATPRMAGFLRENAPWLQLVDQGNIELFVLEPGAVQRLSPRLSLLAVRVPHRDEWSDTVAVVAEGRARRLLYCPDVDGWSPWEEEATRLVESVDVALLDGTFYSADELPGRSLDEIPHPLVVDTVERMAGRAAEVWLVHLNHTNPLLADGPERRWLAAQGVGAGAFGQRWRLD